MATLKVFAFDYACGGGPAVPRPAAARRQDGALMLAALCADLRALPDVELLTFDDGAGQPFERRFAEYVQAADAVWPLAPVGNGILERLSRDVLRHGRILLGSAPDAVRIAASKQSTFAALARVGVPTVATFGAAATLPASGGAWVAKPDDGAGCVDTRLFPDSGAAQAAAVLAATGARGRTFVLQPFMAGRVGSLSLLCHAGTARVLGCNDQRMAVHDNQFRFLGATVNGLAGMAPQLEGLAQAVAAALPGLWGYAGVDFILAAGGALVLDVNPRLTISYAGLRASTRANPAEAVLALLQGTSPHALAHAPRPGASPVSVDVVAFAPR